MAVKRLLRCVQGIANRKNLFEVLRFADPEGEQDVVLSEAFTLSLQRIARSSAGALRWVRCNDSVNASLSTTFCSAWGSSFLNASSRFSRLATPFNASRESLNGQKLSSSA